MIKEEIRKVIENALKELGITETGFVVEHPADLKMGDYSTNVGIKTGKAREIYAHLAVSPPSGVERVELAGPGFINFYLSKEFFKKSLKKIIDEGENFGKSEYIKGTKIMVEHTDPNPFKEFHIGHLMPNVIGSTLARIFEWNGAEVKQVNYQGDVGLHVAKAVWAIREGKKDNAYALGHKAYEEDQRAKKEIEDINKEIYDKSDEEINKIYEEGKKKSLESFEVIYKRLGTKFDYYFFESETGEAGKKIVQENIGRVFEESDGAIVFKGEKFGPSLHTRVFINSQGLPTYEAKDLGNAKNKYDHYPYDLSVVVTSNEIKEYFRVMLTALSQIYPELAKKTKHLSHGILRLLTGKMSSRTGNVITAEALIEEVKGKVKGDEQVAIGAIKYMILRQAIGNDIVFDLEKSVSIEGDSGVYLQYAYARANSLLKKADSQGRTLLEVGQGSTLSRETHEVEKLLHRFPEIVERAAKEYAPNYITTYLTELSSSFNNFYANEQVLNDSSESAYRLAIVQAFSIVIKNGLTILGIPTPLSM